LNKQFSSKWLPTYSALQDLIKKGFKSPQSVKMVSNLEITFTSPSKVLNENDGIIITLPEGFKFI